jgi:hypothetical protein
MRARFSGFKLMDVFNSGVASTIGGNVRRID